MEKLMNKMEDMEMDKVAGGSTPGKINRPGKIKPHKNSLFKTIKKLFESDDKPTPKPAPTAPPKPTIDPEEVKRQQREDMKRLNNGFGIPDFDKDFH